MPPQEDGAYRDEATLRKRPGADQMLEFEPVHRPSQIRRESFLEEFASSKGPPQIVILIMLLALGFGSTIGVVRGRRCGGGQGREEHLFVKQELTT